MTDCNEKTDHKVHKPWTSAVDAKGHQCQDYGKYTPEDTAVLIQELDQPYERKHLKPLPSPDAVSAASLSIQPQLGMKRKQKNSLNGKAKFELTEYSVIWTGPYKRDYLNHKREEIN